MKKITIISNNTSETILIGKKISNLLTKGSIVQLNGNIGSGKTHLVKGIVKGLNSKDLVTSPTFNLLQIYQGKFIIYHLDGYRIKSTKEAYEAGLEEPFLDEGVVLIEWSEKFFPFYSDNENIMNIDIKKINNEKRKIIINGVKNDLSWN